MEVVIMMNKSMIEFVANGGNQEALDIAIYNNFTCFKSCTMDIIRTFPVNIRSGNVQPAQQVGDDGDGDEDEEEKVVSRESDDDS